MVHQKNPEKTVSRLPNLELQIEGLYRPPTGAEHKQAENDRKLIWSWDGSHQGVSLKTATNQHILSENIEKLQNPQKKTNAERVQKMHV